MSSIAFAQLPTRCLLLDQRRMDRNISRLAHHLGSLNVGLRPHLKTSKSVNIAHRMMRTRQGPATVSTLKEAEEFAAAGVRTFFMPWASRRQSSIVPLPCADAGSISPSWSIT